MDQGMRKRQLPGERGVWITKTAVGRESNPTGQPSFEGRGLQLLWIELNLHPQKRYFGVLIPGTSEYDLIGDRAFTDVSKLIQSHWEGPDSPVTSVLMKRGHWRHTQGDHHVKLVTGQATRKKACYKLCP